MVIDSKNNKGLSILLASTMNCSVDHHDRLIYELMPNIINANIEITGEYMDARMKTLKYLSVPILKRGSLEDQDESKVSIILLWENIETLSK